MRLNNQLSPGSRVSQANKELLRQANLGWTSKGSLCFLFQRPDERPSFSQLCTMISDDLEGDTPPSNWSTDQSAASTIHSVCGGHVGPKLLLHCCLPSFRRSRERTPWRTWCNHQPDREEGPITPTVVHSSTNHICLSNQVNPVQLTTVNSWTESDANVNWRWCNRNTSALQLSSLPEVFPPRPGHEVLVRDLDSVSHDPQYGTSFSFQ